jgi:hypothetical protein
MEFQQSLNKAQPDTEEDANSRSLIQFLYRKNPMQFCNFLASAKLDYFILWTEAKYIIRYFKLFGTVFVKWIVDKFECCLYKHPGNQRDNLVYNKTNHININDNIDRCARTFNINKSVHFQFTKNKRNQMFVNKHSLGVSTQQQQQRIKQNRRLRQHNTRNIDKNTTQQHGDTIMGVSKILCRTDPLPDCIKPQKIEQSLESTTVVDVQDLSVCDIVSNSVCDQV